MISYFNSEHPDRYLVALLMATIIWLPALLSPEFIPLPGETVFQGLSGFVETYARFIIWGCFLITFVLGVMLNQILKEYDMMNSSNTAGLILLVLMASSVPVFTSVNVFIIINIFLVMVIQGIMRLSQVEYPVAVIFNTSFYLGIAALFFPPLLFLFIIIWMAILMNRHMDLRNFLITLTGLLLPFLFLFTWYFWNGTLVEHWYEIIRQLTDFEVLNIFIVLSTTDIIIFFVILLLSIFSILKIKFGMVETSITTRRNINLTLYFLIGLIVLVFFYSATPVTHLILVPPAAMIVAFAVHEVKNKWLNLLFIALFLIIILNQYGNYFDVKSLLLR